MKLHLSEYINHVMYIHDTHLMIHSLVCNCDIVIYLYKNAYEFVEENYAEAKLTWTQSNGGEM